ncbi:ribosome hibernation-promoting factor, HPF/YfiA family [Paenibacillus sp. GCM10023248]|uniref:ribosome hibernation-promoting factor, HPF/YfiA family n=1 Tax=Bacillales TaxID=1385 RepID=UPI00237955D2|nr:MULTISPECIES: ribosome-associated translation inhibitor RaiA [Bacillales]MDD9271817.1 ribosome-associated translation inhibitor RaiA [Paenibacillus sp. MAHUQ-63]MDR6883461.1 putative sigma-54 modulation protein [Bacillus sp. 3255]
MMISIRGEHLEVTEALRDYVEKKLTRLDRYFDAPLTSDVQVKLSVVKGLQAIEVSIPLTGVLLRAEERNTDMYASIDLVVDKLERQIRKHKTRTNRKIREEGGKRDLFKIETSPVTYVDEEEDFELVRNKRFDLKPMDVEEAILQMNLVGHNFFVFSNMDTDTVNVVYKRNDGKYGLIEPAI